MKPAQWERIFKGAALYAHKYLSTRLASPIRVNDMDAIKAEDVAALDEDFEHD